MQNIYNGAIASTLMLQFSAGRPENMGCCSSLQAPCTYDNCRCDPVILGKIAISVLSTSASKFRRKCWAIWGINQTTNTNVLQLTESVNFMPSLHIYLSVYLIWAWKNSPFLPWPSKTFHSFFGPQKNYHPSFDPAVQSVTNCHQRDLKTCQLFCGVDKSTHASLLRGMGVGVWFVREGGDEFMDGRRDRVRQERGREWVRGLVILLFVDLLEER